MEPSILIAFLLISFSFLLIRFRSKTLKIDASLYNINSNELKNFIIDFIGDNYRWSEYVDGHDLVYTFLEHFVVRCTKNNIYIDVEYSILSRTNFDSLKEKIINEIFQQYINTELD